MALPDDGRMDVADTVTIGNAISAQISPALKGATVGINLVVSQDFSSDSPVIKFRKSGSLVAEVVAEGAVYLPTDANSDINDTSITVTSAKVVVASPISAEAMRFGAGAANIERVAAEQGRAIARKFDSDLFTLFSSIASTATAGAAMDWDTVLLGQFNIISAETPVTRLVAVISAKQEYELKLDSKNSMGSAFVQPNNLAILAGQPQANGYLGTQFGVDLYRGFGLPTSGGRTLGAIWEVTMGYCAGFGGPVETQVQNTGVGVASQVAGLSMIPISHLFYDVKEYNDLACSQLRSTT